ncbi:hypothetical protein [Thiosocius teredinicola]|uniref:hypothetical protein n=1 Tax=Thiosocius teredinicola TaxID=1973002 RepID=UPI000990B78E
MKKSERYRLETWVALRGKERISFIDVLSIQPKPFWLALVFSIGLGVFVVFEFGPYSLPFGVFLGGLASTLGYFVRIKRNLPVDLRYMNWEAVNSALDE